MYGSKAPLQPSEKSRLRSTAGRTTPSRGGAGAWAAAGDTSRAHDGRNGVMTYRNMGKTGARVSTLGFGCMRLPMMKDAGTVDRDKALPMLMRAYEQGVNYFDTGKWYCGQDSERTLGEAVKGMDRNRIYLSTKYAQGQPTAKDLR